MALASSRTTSRRWQFVRHRAASTPWPQRTDAVAQELNDFYFGTGVEVFVDLPGKSTRAVIIDGDIAVPGQPSVFDVGGVPTLYLHWTSAEIDIEQLLDTPAFKTLSAATNEDDCLHPRDATAATVTTAAGEPNEILAYVDEEADETATSKGLGGLSQPPLADTTPTEQWPFPVTAARTGRYGGWRRIAPTRQDLGRSACDRRRAR